jgi:outer membrane protein OmpA-like peptidoglycan-associated protein
MMKVFGLCISFLFIVHFVTAQSIGKPGVNLIENGEFEEGNTGFTSSYLYTSQKTLPGYYSVTNDAPSINSEFKNPDGGDHTPNGNGIFMIINSDGMKGQKVWCSTVQVIPNSNYVFTMYFCNVYKLLPPKTNFVFEKADVKGNDPKIRVTIGTEEIIEERDYFHMFKWLQASATWYSGEHRGPVRICIENLNTSMDGNDLALDDISLVYIETMPANYKPPVKLTSVMNKDYMAPPVAKRKVPLSDYGVFQRNDSLGDGISSIQYKKPQPEEEIKEDTQATPQIDRVQLKTLMFAQSKTDLLPTSLKELDLIADWLKRDTDVRIRFIGHTDNQGDPLLNVKLSEQRVQKVKSYLVSKGIAADRIETAGYGGAFPIADNSNEESRKLNRRVEMEILK